MKRIQRSLCDHIVIIGYGTKNSRAVQELIDLGAEPHDIVVVDTKEDRLELAKALGCTVLKADATHDETPDAHRRLRRYADTRHVGCRCGDGGVLLYGAASPREAVDAQQEESRGI
jgi:Zn-dependent alcohol dehydrogenase